MSELNESAQDVEIVEDAGTSNRIPDIEETVEDTRASDILKIPVLDTIQPGQALVNAEGKAGGTAAAGGAPTDAGFGSELSGRAARRAAAEELFSTSNKKPKIKGGDEHLVKIISEMSKTLSAIVGIMRAAQLRSDLKKLIDMSEGEEKEMYQRKYKALLVKDLHDDLIQEERNV